MPYGIMPYFEYQILFRETEYKIRYQKFGNGGTDNPGGNPKSAKTQIVHTAGVFSCINWPDVRHMGVFINLDLGVVHHFHHLRL